jgi:hypothetical protein
MEMEHRMSGRTLSGGHSRCKTFAHQAAVLRSELSSQLSLMRPFTVFDCEVRMCWRGGPCGRLGSPTKDWPPPAGGRVED